MVETFKDIDGKWKVRNNSVARTEIRSACNAGGDVSDKEFDNIQEALKVCRFRNKLERQKEDLYKGVSPEVRSFLMELNAQKESLDDSDIRAYADYNRLLDKYKLTDNGYDLARHKRLMIREIQEQ